MVVSIYARGLTGRQGKGFVYFFLAHLLDQHVQVLRDIGGEACCEITLSAHDRTEAFVFIFARFSAARVTSSSCAMGIGL